MIYNNSVLDKQKAQKTQIHTTAFKVEENSRTFQGPAQKFNDFSSKNGIQGLFKDFLRLYEPWITPMVSD